MVTEEALKLIDMLRKIQATQGKEFDLNQFQFNDEDHYFQATRIFSLNLIESLNQYRSDLIFERLFKGPFLFDLIV